MENYRKCIFIDATDIMYSPDFLVIQFINKYRSIIKMKDAINYKRRILSIAEDKSILPMNNIKEDKRGDLIITNLFDEEFKDTDTMLRDFIKNKNGLCIFKDILKDIQKDYSMLLNEVYPITNSNLSGIYLQDSNFILYSNRDFDELSILKNLIQTKEHIRLIDKDKIWEFFGTYTDKAKDIGISFTLFSSDTNIMETIKSQHKYILDWQVPLINMETLFLSYTLNNIDYAKDIHDKYEHDKSQEIFQTGVIDIWEDGIISKILRATPYSIL